MPRFRVTFLEVITHSAIIEVEAESEEEVREQFDGVDSYPLEKMVPAGADLLIDDIEQLDFDDTDPDD